eukprot:m.85953 g.85953  ORF g.85953 m.85953 type:complete len:745 (+) comp25912_c0_seq1:143-2377(+)
MSALPPNRREGHLAGRLICVRSESALPDSHKLVAHPQKKKITDSVVVMDKETAINVLLQGKMSDELVEHWQILRVLGHGAFGTVFHVKNYNTHEAAALKVIQRAKVTDKAALRNEIIALRRCAHPSVTRLIAHYSDDHAEYILLEECKGGDMLEYVMTNGHLSNEPLAFLFKQVLQGLAYIHNHKIIHRDLKLENLLLIDKSNLYEGVRIADFGIVHLFPIHTTVEDRHKEIVSGTEYAGSVQYMAPEIVKSTDYTHKVDLWSAGVVLYTMAFEAFPFAGTDEEVLKQLRHTKGVDLSDEFFKTVDNDLIDLIRRLLDSNPETRIDTGAALDHPFIRKLTRLSVHDVPHSTPGRKITEELLPPGWECQIGDNGRIFYVHEEGGHKVSTWVDPRERLKKASLTDDTMIDALDVGFSLRRSKQFDASLAAISAIVTPQNAIEELLSTTMSPEVVNQWRVIKPLGHGAYGTVVLVQNRKTQERAALKLIQMNKVSDPAELETEIEALRRCHHSCVTGILQTYRDERFQYLAMEACPGGDFLDYLMDGFAPMQDADASFAFGEITRGVAYLHSRGILHRDLKPDNILLVERGNIRAGLRICDFGLVHLFPIHTAMRKSATDFLSQEAKQKKEDVVTDGSLAGTYLYLAPEVILGHVYSFPVDIWSCGVILHAMAFAYFPFDDDDDQTLCSMIACAKKLQFSPKKFKRKDPDLLALLSSLLEPKPEKRITTKEVLQHPFIQSYNPTSML